jgi:hypothetical protein
MIVHLVDGSSSVDARVHPGLAGRTSCAAPPTGRWVVQGHFDDPAATECATGSDGAAELARYRCRAIFVVTELAPAAP